MSANPIPRWPASADEQQIRRAAQLLFPWLQPGGDVVEARLIYDTIPQRIDSGYFDNADPLAEALIQADQRNAEANPHAAGLYWTLNPVKRELFARAANRIAPRAKRATRGDDISQRKLVVLDVDPIRPAGISSTDDEHEAAIELAQCIRSELLADGWPEPLLMDSGNGAQMVFRIDLPNDDASNNLLENLLDAVAQRFDNGRAKIDRLLFDAPRCFKAPGTVARKGDHIAERPHRMARILSHPVTLQVVQRNLIENAAKATRAHSTTSGSQQQADGKQGTYPPFGVPVDINDWLAKHGLSARGPIPYNGGWKWILRCPFNSNHVDSAIIQTPPLYRPAFSCPHTSCSNENWDTLNHKLDPKYQSGGATGSASAPIELHSLSPGDLYDLEIPKPELLVEQCIPRRGAVLFTGVQKVGKTILASQIAISVARNQPLFDVYRVLHPGPTLILEQDDPDGAASVREILQAANVPRDGPVQFIRKNPAFVLGDSLIEALEKRINHDGLVLVVLDSYTALRPPRKAGGDIVKSDQADMTLLDELGKRAGCAVILLHHDSNAGRQQRDWASSAAGTFGLTMATESQIHIARYSDLPISATERHVRLLGRHLKTNEMVLRFDEKRLAYDHILEGDGACLYPTILNIYTLFGTNQFSVKDYYQKIGVSRSTGHRTVLRLLLSGILQRNGSGYSLVQAC
jgi:hypothetical protein